VEIKTLILNLRISATEFFWFNVKIFSRSATTSAPKFFLNWARTLSLPYRELQPWKHLTIQNSRQQTSMKFVLTR